jgi:hypothetical protein
MPIDVVCAMFIPTPYWLVFAIKASHLECPDEVWNEIAAPRGQYPNKV